MLLLLIFVFFYRSENVKLLSQAEFNDERFKVLQHNSEVLQRQVAAMQSNNSTLHGNFVLFCCLCLAFDSFNIVFVNECLGSSSSLRGHFCMGK